GPVLGGSPMLPLTSLPLVGTYLELTENWLYRRLVGLRRYCPVVLTWRLADAEVYPLDDVRVLGPYPVWQRALNRLTRWPLVHLNGHFRVMKGNGARVLHSHFAPLAVAGHRLRRIAQPQLGCATVTSL